MIHFMDQGYSTTGILELDHYDSYDFSYLKITLYLKLLNYSEKHKIFDHILKLVSL